MTTFYTSDHHFEHANILTYAQRPFQDVDEMNEILVIRWNKVVQPDDVVYHLGDFTFGNHETAAFYFGQLNGIIHVLGNPWHHDSRWLEGKRMVYLSKSKHVVTILPPMVVLEGAGGLNKDKRPVPVVLCHYPLAEFDRKHYGALHFFGHSHNNFQKRKNCLDVGVDSAYQLLGEHRPFAFNEAIELASSFLDE